jgi:hypothetical protein
MELGKHFHHNSKLLDYFQWGRYKTSLAIHQKMGAFWWMLELLWLLLECPNIGESIL